MVYTIAQLQREPGLLRHCGNKAVNLLKMIELDLPVPPFVVLPDVLLQELMSNNYDENHEIWSRLIHVIKSHLPANSKWSVRSSASSEDSGQYSFAGMFHTELFVRPDMFPAAIRKCVEVLQSYDLQAYALQNNIPENDIRLSLIVQEMIEPTVSGVVFTMNAAGNYNDMLISCAVGVGTGVVENKASTTEYYINRQNREISRIPTQPDLLSVIQLQSLIQKCLLLEKVMESPQDIEFAFVHDQLWMLQTRPVTTIDLSHLKIIDNTNIVESFPGITLPLTFSFALKGYKEVFTSAARLFHLSEKDIYLLSDELSNMIVHVKGRVYYNLHHWYKVMGHVIASEKSLRAWETLIGVKSKQASVARISVFKKIKVFFVAVSLLFRYKSLVNKFYISFNKDYKVFRRYVDQLHLNHPTAREALHFYTTISESLYSNWSVTLLNDFFTYRFYGGLNRFLTKLYVEQPETVVNDLLCGEPGVESEELVKEILNIKELIRNDVAYMSLFQQDAAIITGNVPPELQKTLDTFIDCYGDRTLEELKLESQNLRQNPVNLIKLLQSYLENTDTAEQVTARQHTIRKQAEMQVNEALTGRVAQQWFYAYLLRMTRFSIKNRENMRLCRARAYGLAKEMFLYMASELVQKEKITFREDIFYLSFNELEDCISDFETHDWKAIIDLRKQEFAPFEGFELPDRMVFNGDEIPWLKPYQKRMSTDKKLYGTGISRGEITAACIVLDKPDLQVDVKGKILVTRMTDPAWVFLMSRAAGLISEKGSPLSHTAIVGRELGIPVIIGVPDATHILQNDMLVTMKCSEGEIRII